ncbi:hypothetical protein ACSLN1_26005, partial [Escherichia coli]|uniref:hypothetical protein n=1 Tax=Escherichia coli TaxID=562 RepID=UPI003EDFB71E
CSGSHSTECCSHIAYDFLVFYTNDNPVFFVTVKRETVRLTNIRVLAFVALGAGFVVSLIIPVAALIKLNEKKENIFGDARFAT